MLVVFCRAVCSCEGVKEYLLSTEYRDGQKVLESICVYDVKFQIGLFDENIIIYLQFKY